MVRRPPSPCRTDTPVSFQTELWSALPWGEVSLARGAEKKPKQAFAPGKEEMLPRGTGGGPALISNEYASGRFGYRPSCLSTYRHSTSSEASGEDRTGGYLPRSK